MGGNIYPGHWSETSLLVMHRLHFCIPEVFAWKKKRTYRVLFFVLRCGHWTQHHVDCACCCSCWCFHFTGFLRRFFPSFVFARLKDGTENKQSCANAVFVWSKRLWRKLHLCHSEQNSERGEEAESIITKWAKYNILCPREMPQTSKWTLEAMRSVQNRNAYGRHIESRSIKESPNRYRDQQASISRTRPSYNARMPAYLLHVLTRRTSWSERLWLAVKILHVLNDGSMQIQWNTIVCSSLQYAPSAKDVNLIGT